jgi:hypothetical protein
MYEEELAAMAEEEAAEERARKERAEASEFADYLDSVLGEVPLEETEEADQPPVPYGKQEEPEDDRDVVEIDEPDEDTIDEERKQERIEELMTPHPLAGEALFFDPVEAEAQANLEIGMDQVLAKYRRETPERIWDRIYDYVGSHMRTVPRMQWSGFVTDGKCHPVDGLIDPKTGADLPGYRAMRKWIHETLQEGKGFRFMAAGSVVRGLTVDAIVEGIFRLLNGYANEDKLAGWGIQPNGTLRIFAIPPTFRANRNVGVGLFPVWTQTNTDIKEADGDYLGELISGVRVETDAAKADRLLCFLSEVRKKWGSLGPLCRRLNKKWADDKGCTEERIKEFVREAGKRENSQWRIGVQLLSKAGNEWWSYNTGAKNVIRLSAGCNHVEAAREVDWDGATVNDVPDAEFDTMLVGGLWSKIAHRDAFFREKAMYRRKSFVDDLHLQAGAMGASPKTRLNYDFAQEFKKYPACRTISAVSAAIFRARAGVFPLKTDDPMCDYLAAAQIEHVAVELAPIKEDYVEYDCNSCFASYRNHWDTEYYRRYGLPGLPSIGGWLPEDITQEEQSAILMQTGWCFVDKIAVKNWTLAVFPYLVDNRPYPTVWLRFIADRGLADFRVRHAVLAGSFFDTDLAGGHVMRQVIGKWMQKTTTSHYFVKDPKEAERLCWENAHKLNSWFFGSEDMLGGTMLTFEAEKGVMFPHLRSFVLAYSHITVFCKLLALKQGDVVAVKTDAIITRKEMPSVFILGGDPGLWKIACNTSKGVFKQRGGQPCGLRHFGYGTARAEDFREKLSGELAAPPPPMDGDFGVLVRGDSDGGVAPIKWETSWLLPFDAYFAMNDTGNADAIPKEFHIRPLHIFLSGPGGFGKTEWSARYAASITFRNRIGVTAYQHDTVEKVLRPRFPRCTAARTLLSWICRSPGWRNSATASMQTECNSFFVDEASMLTAEMFSDLRLKTLNHCTFIAGDEAQCPPVIPGVFVEYGPFKALAETGHRIDFTRDFRSANAQTAAFKAEIRALRLRGAPPKAYGKVFTKYGITRLESLDALKDRYKHLAPGDIATHSLVVCGLRKRSLPVVNKAMLALFNANGGGRTSDDTAVVPIRCKKTHKGGNAGELRLVPFVEYRKLHRAAPGKWELAYAATVHSVQGKTVDKPTDVTLYFDWAPPGLIYTAVSRVRDICQLNTLTPGGSKKGSKKDAPHPGDAPVCAASPLDLEDVWDMIPDDPDDETEIQEPSTLESTLAPSGIEWNDG